MSNGIDDLVHDELVIPVVISNTVGRVDAFVVQAVLVYAVDGVDLDEPLLQKPTCRFYQFEVLTLIVPAHGGREDNYRVTGMSVHQHFNVSAEGW